MGTTYEKYPKPGPDMDAGRSATKVSDRHGGGGQMESSGSMGKSQSTGDGMENEGSSHGSSHKGGTSHKGVTGHKRGKTGHM